MVPAPGVRRVGEGGGRAPRVPLPQRFRPSFTTKALGQWGIGDKLPSPTPRKVPCMSSMSNFLSAHAGFSNKARSANAQRTPGRQRGPWCGAQAAPARRCCCSGPAPSPPPRSPAPARPISSFFSSTVSPRGWPWVGWGWGLSGLLLRAGADPLTPRVGWGSALRGPTQTC